jgi:hypothetical protein
MMMMLKPSSQEVENSIQRRELFFFFKESAITATERACNCKSREGEVQV